MTKETALLRSQYVLQYAYGITLVLIGLDKVFQTNLLAEWISYVSPLAQAVLPFEPLTIVVTLGVAEIIVGILLFTKLVRFAAYVVILVLAVIIVNLLNLGLYDIAARDFLIALGALMLTWITSARENAYG